MRALQDCRLYGIVDLGYLEPGNGPAVTRALVEGGVDLVQLRAKKRTGTEIARLAERMLGITRPAGVPLVINDHADIAAKIGAEGVHVGQDDAAVERARELTGGKCFVGKSTHSLAQAVAAQAEGADYIGFGPLYATGTKPDYQPIGLHDIAMAHEQVNLPIFCIGGVNPARLDAVLAAGARRVVVVSAFLLAADVRQVVSSLKARLPSL